MLSSLESLLEGSASTHLLQSSISSEFSSSSHETEYLKGEAPGFRPQRVAGFGELEGNGGLSREAAAVGPSTFS